MASQLNGLKQSWGSNPASPSLGFLGGLFLSEEVPEGWWGRLLGLSDLIENKLPS